MKGIIDRFEGEYAVVETEHGSIDIPKKHTANAAEGDVIEFTGGGHEDWNVSVLQEETEKRAERINNLMKDLFET